MQFGAKIKSTLDRLIYKRSSLADGSLCHALADTAHAGGHRNAAGARSMDLHVRAALTEGGFTPDYIKEIVLQQTIYCGVPGANHATREASAVLQELGLLKG